MKTSSGGRHRTAEEELELTSLVRPQASDNHDARQGGRSDALGGASSWPSGQCLLVCVAATCMFGGVFGVVYAVVGASGAADFGEIHHGGGGSSVIPSTAPGGGQVRYAQGFVQSENDHRTYGLMDLPSGLRAVLVSDPETDRAAAAMDVGVGSLSDPVEWPGLAHFLEHMLFMGTHRFPGEDEYSKYLNDHGGRSNAYTAGEHTNFYFDVEQAHLRGALDRFSQFFCAPLFLESSVSRELQAVESEHRKNIESDDWRLSQLLKNLSSPQHAFSHFSTGDLSTLNRTGVRRRLLEFYAKHYDPRVMRLVVLGREPLDVLARWTDNLFRQLKAPTRTRRTQGSPRAARANHGPYGPYPQPGGPTQPSPFLGKIVRLVPVRATSRLNLMWPLGPSEQLFRSLPHAYVSYLLGHEGPGSVLSELRSLGWARELTAGIGHDGHDFALFQCELVLTDMGQAHLLDVVALVFRYIGRVLRAPGGVARPIHNEMVRLATLRFRFKEKGQASSYASALAARFVRLDLCCGSRLAAAETAAAAGDTGNMSDAGAAAHLDTMGEGEEEVAGGAATAAAPFFLPTVDLLGSPSRRLWDPSAIEEVLQRLTPQAALVISESPAYQALGAAGGLDAVEPIYGTRFAAAALAPELIAQWTRLVQPPEQQKQPLDGSEQLTLHLPAPNPFLPDVAELGLIPVSPVPGADSTSSTQDVPLVPHAREATGGQQQRVWWAPDYRFRVPKVYLLLRLPAACMYGTPQDTVLGKLWAAAVDEELAGEAYAATLAGYAYDLAVTRQGTDLTVKGYSDLGALRSFVGRVAEAMMNPLPQAPMAGGAMKQDRAAEARFQLVRERLFQSLANFDKAQPYRHAMYFSGLATERPRWSIAAQVAALKSSAVSLAALRAFMADKLFSGGVRGGGFHWVEAMVHGNIARDDAEALVAVLRRQLLKWASPAGKAGAGAGGEAGGGMWAGWPGLPRVIQLPRVGEGGRGGGINGTKGLLPQLPYAPPRRLPCQMNVLHAASLNPADSNSALHLQFQRPRPSAVRAVKLNLLAQLAKEPCFDQLRTREQLGYLVFSFPRNVFGVRSFDIVLQSATRDPAYLLGRTVAFLEHFRNSTLADLAPSSPSSRAMEDTAAWVQAKRTLARKLAERAVNLGQAAQWMWDEITSRALRFNRTAEMLEALEGVTAAELVAFYDSTVGLSPDSRSPAQRAPTATLAAGPGCRTTGDRANGGNGGTGPRSLAVLVFGGGGARNHSNATWPKDVPWGAAEPITMDDLDGLTDGADLYPTAPG